MLFIQHSVLSNYADDNNLSVIGKNEEDIKSLLFLDFEIVTDWFYEKLMVLNSGKSRNMCLGENVDDNDLTVKSSREVEISGIEIDSNLNLKTI